MNCSIKDYRFASFAHHQAYQSSLPMRHGCIAVSSGKIIARGHNHYRTYSKDGLIENCCSCHAEIDVLRKCLKRNKSNKINMYIVRISNTGEYKNSAPCNNCINILQKHNIRMIIYSTDEGTLKKHKLINYTNYHKTGGEKAIITKRVIFKRKGKYFVYK